MTNSANKDISNDQFIEIIRYPKEILERTSQRFINDLYREGFKNNNLHPQEVIDQIIHLETGNKSKTKDAAPFRGSQLQGLWHKHYKTTGMETLELNALLAARSDKNFSNKIEEIVKKSNGDIFRISSEYAELYVKGIFERSEASKSTGEWIIFAKHKDSNYYFCLSKHDDSDKEIRDKVVSCSDQFPFIKQLLKA